MPSRPPRTAPAAAVRLFVDSGAWIALRSRRDQHHVAADRAFRAAIEHRIHLVTTNLVLAEIHRLTLFRAGLEPALAGRLARATVSGAGELLARSELDASVLRQNVTSPGGTTAAALAVLMAEGGIEELMRKAVLAGEGRSRELAK